MRFRLTKHAEEEMKRRQISQEILDSVLHEPDQVVSEHSGRKAYQSRVLFAEDGGFLVRAIVDESVDPAAVITVYRTSRISKYWRSE